VDRNFTFAVIGGGDGFLEPSLSLNRPKKGSDFAIAAAECGHTVRRCRQNRHGLMARIVRYSGAQPLIANPRVIQHAGFLHDQRYLPESSGGANRDRAAPVHVRAAEGTSRKAHQTFSDFKN